MRMTAKLGLLLVCMFGFQSFIDLGLAIADSAQDRAPYHTRRPDMGSLGLRLSPLSTGSTGGSMFGGSLDRAMLAMGLASGSDTPASIAAPTSETIAELDEYWSTRFGNPHLLEQLRYLTSFHYACFRIILVEFTEALSV